MGGGGPSVTMSVSMLLTVQNDPRRPPVPESSQMSFGLVFVGTNHLRTTAEHVRGHSMPRAPGVRHTTSAFGALWHKLTPLSYVQEHNEILQCSAASAAWRAEVARGEHCEYHRVEQHASARMCARM